MEGYKFFLGGFESFPNQRRILIPQRCLVGYSVYDPEEEIVFFVEAAEQLRESELKIEEMERTPRDTFIGDLTKINISEERVSAIVEAGRKFNESKREVKRTEFALLELLNQI